MFRSSMEEIGFTPILEEVKENDDDLYLNSS